MNLPRRALPPEPQRRGWCPSLGRPMPTGDGLLARIHPPLGILTLTQLRAVAQAARLFGNGHVDVTARANLQIRGVRDATAADLAASLTAAGLGDRRRDGGPQRLTLTSPVAGLDPGETVDVLALARVIEAAALDIPALSPKTLLAIEGAGVSSEGADIVLRPQEDGRMAITLAGDGGAAISVAEPDAADAVGAMLHGFVATGRRRVRDLSVGERLVVRLASENAARRHPPPPSAGEGGPRVSEGRERGTPFPDAALPSPACSAGTLPRRGGRDPRAAFASGLPVGLTRLGARTILAVEAPFGRCVAETIDCLAGIADSLGCPDIRVSPSRGFVLACDDPRAAVAALDRLAAHGFVTASDDPRRAVAACPGAPACASGSTPVPDHAASLAQAFAPFAAQGLRAHVSGCAKGCARPAPSDLTLVGESGRYGVVLEGGPDARPARLLAFEALLERVSRADPTRPLRQAFDT